MAFVLADRVKETTLTTGTGAVTLVGAVFGYQSFAAVGNGNTTYYVIAGQTTSEWEVGIGTYTASGTTLSRTTVLASSNSGSLVNFSSGAKDVFVSYPAGRSVARDSANILTLNAGTTNAPPLAFQSGTNLTTATAGAMEYDGRVIYATPQGAQRGVVPGSQFFAVNSGIAGANATGAQSIFGASVTLSSSTVYEFEYFLALGKSAGTTSHTVAFGVGGTATLNSFSVNALTQYNTANFATGTPAFFYSTTPSSTVWTSAITTASMTVVMNGRGLVSVNAGGTFTPQYTLSAAPGGAYTTQPGSFFLIYPVGAAGSNISVGTWA